MAGTVLDINTVVDQNFVRIDGKQYTLKTRDQMSIVHLARLEKQGPRIGELMQRAGQTIADTGTATTGLSAAEEDELSDGLALIAAAVLDAPADVHARLTDVQRINIATAFAMLQSPKMMAAALGANQPGRQSRRTGAPSPPASNGSTGARTRRRG